MSDSQALGRAAVWNSAFGHLLRRDIKLGMRRPVETVTPVGFSLVVATLFAFGAGPEIDALEKIAPGVIWTAALLGMVISVESMFSSDHEDGTLEQLLISPQQIPVMVLAKILARWCWSAAPLIAISPLLGSMLGMSPGNLPQLALSLLLGTPTLFLLGAFGAALLVGQRRGTALLALLVLPLCVPVLIFASGMVELATSGLSTEGAASLLGALLALAVAFMPLAISVVLQSNGSEG